MTYHALDVLSWSSLKNEVLTPGGSTLDVYSTGRLRIESSTIAPMAAFVLPCLHSVVRHLYSILSLVQWYRDLPPNRIRKHYRISNSDKVFREVCGLIVSNVCARGWISSPCMSAYIQLFDKPYLRIFAVYEHHDSHSISTSMSSYTQSSKA